MAGLDDRTSDNYDGCFNPDVLKAMRLVSSGDVSQINAAADLLREKGFREDSGVLPSVGRDQKDEPTLDEQLAQLEAEYREAGLSERQIQIFLGVARVKLNKEILSNELVDPVSPASPVQASVAAQPDPPASVDVPQSGEDVLGTVARRARMVQILNQLGESDPHAFLTYLRGEDKS
jgi:hypothetical protein